MKRMALLMAALGVGLTALWATPGSPQGWVAQSSGTTRNLYGVHFVSPDTGWAAGGYGVILRTYDGGTTWNSLSSGTSDDFYDVIFINSRLGWVVGYHGMILLTTDGGTTWSPATQSGTNEDLWCCNFSDSLNGWAVGKNGTIVHTTDGGHIWSSQPSGVSNWLKWVFPYNSDTVWACGKDGTILKTTNGGTSWVKQWEGQTSHCLNRVVFPENPLEGWIGGRFGYVIHTTDGGSTWVQQRYDYPNCLMAGVYFTDNQCGWGAGKYGVITSTINGGQDWIDESSGTSEFLRALHAVGGIDRSYVWVVGHSGTILHKVYNWAYIGTAPDSFAVSVPIGQTRHDTLIISNPSTTGSLNFNILRTTDAPSKGFNSVKLPPEDAWVAKDRASPRPALSSGAHPGVGLTLGKQGEVILSEGFEGSWPPPGWRVIKHNNDSSHPIPGYWSKTDYTLHSGSYAAGLWWSYSHQDEWLITPKVYLDGRCTLTFWTYGYQGSTHGDHYYVKVSTDGGESWEEVFDLADDFLPDQGWNAWNYPYEIDLSAYAGDTVEIAWQAEDPPSNDGLWWVWVIDDVTIYGPTWLTLNPLRGIVPPGGEMEVEVTFSPDTSMDEDTTYTGEIQIYNNSLNNSEVILPVEMRVAAGIYEEYFADGELHLSWFAGWEGSELTPISFPDNPSGDGWVGRLTNQEKAMVAVSLAGSDTLKDYSVEAYLYTQVSDTVGPHHGVVARWDTTTGFYYLLGCDFGDSARIELSYNEGDTRSVIHRWTSDSIPGIIPDTTGWHRLKLKAVGDSLWAYFDEEELPGCPFTDSRASSGFFGIYAFASSWIDSTLCDDIIVRFERPEVGIDEEPVTGQLPTSFNLAQNYPNPFNPTTEIAYNLPMDCRVKLEVYNLLGQRVTTLVDQPQKAGYHQVRWKAKVASGVYFYRIWAGDYMATKKMVLLR